MLWLIGYIIIGLAFSIVYLIRYIKKGKMNELSKIRRISTCTLFIVVYTIIWLPIELFSFIFAIVRFVKIHAVHSSDSE